MLDDILLAAIKAVAPVIRKQVEKGYEKLKEKAGTTEKLYDDSLVYLVGIVLGEEGKS